MGYLAHIAHKKCQRIKTLTSIKLLIMSYVIYRKRGGGKKIDYFGKKGFITSVNVSKEEAEKYKGKKQGDARLAYSKAEEYNQSIKSGVDSTPTETFFDPETGRKITPFEASSMGKMTTATGETALVKVSVNKPTPAAPATTTPAPAPSSRPVSMVSAASTQESKALKKNQSVVYKTVRSFKEGLTLKGGVTEQYRAGVDSSGEKITPAQSIAYAGGLVGNIALIKPVASGANAARVAVAQSYSNVLGKIGVTSKAARGAVGGVTTVFSTIGAAKTTEFVGEKIASTNPRTSTFINTGQAEAARQAGVSAEGLTGFRAYAASVPGINLVMRRDEKAFSSGVATYAQTQGITDITGLEKAARQRENIKTASLSAAALTANTLTEIQGNAALAGVTPAATWGGRFAQSAPRIALQGSFEGSSLVLAEQVTSNKDFRSVNYKDVAIGAGLGAASAGLAGGFIYASKPLVSKGLLGVAYLTDPYEAVGDIGASGIKSRVLTLGSPAVGGVAVSSKSSSFTSSATTTAAASPTLFQSRVYSFNPVTSSLSNTQTPIRNSFNVFNNIFSRTPTTTSSVGISPVVSNTFSSVTPVTSTTTTTAATALTSSSVVVTTPTTLLPLMPFSLGGFGGGSKMSFDNLKQGRSYQPSLSAAVLGIKGSKPGGYAIKTGLVVRPV